MKKISINTNCKKLLADVFTPVGIYLRLRDRFRDTILLESTDHHVAENSYSFICINAIGGIEVTSMNSIEFKLPAGKAERIVIQRPSDVPKMLAEFLQRFEPVTNETKEAKFAQGLFGYTSYDAVRFFDDVNLPPISLERGPGDSPLTSIPLIRYRLYQYVIAINHFKDELIICENILPGLESDVSSVESLIYSKDVPVYPFTMKGAESSNLTDDEYKDMVKRGIQSCHRGDVFQIVLSRRFEQGFIGDEFNVYRALRNINPSPYLFFFDYGDYKLMGSSPESQLIIQNGKAVVHPIAGTFRRTGNDDTDHTAAQLLLSDKKENAEHVMLVDLARNDLSRVCDDVEVAQYKEIQYYSHVIHMVSEVTGKLRKDSNVFDLLARTFPAGTLSGAPKIRAMQLINEFEPTPRGFYGGAIGYIGFDGSCNHAIMIRTFLSRNNTLVRQAGAGIVAASKPASELDEVNNKLNALKKAMGMAEGIC
ncbi:MAG: anthranilate synthase component I family protein [Chitinophagaceae bacterium]|nr:anthranilate synthase component I family protein [Chitinophagaceae bacterium]